MSISEDRINSPFNSSLETGVRSLIILVECYPTPLDLQRLVDFDYLIVHTEDVGGPTGLHPPLPLRAGELLVGRKIIEEGLMLIMSKGLVGRITSDNGFGYSASEDALPFVNSLSSKYLILLRDRAKWVVRKFGKFSRPQLQDVTSQFFDRWTMQFHPQQGNSD